MIKYNTAIPYFFDDDIEEILSQFGSILRGDGLMTMGPKVTEFEQAFAEYVGARRGVATNSCTAALEVALGSAGIGPGDEVAVPAQTFFATGSAVVSAGATPLVCEVDENFMIDLDDLERRAGPALKGVIAVHFAGMPHPEIARLQQWCSGRNVALIEDAAHAHGAKVGDAFAGALGDYGCFSFFSTKIMATGEGGMVVVNDESSYLKAGTLRNRGMDMSAPAEIFTEFGSNRRFTEFQAILGIYQLKRLETFVEHRNRIADIYRDRLMPAMQSGLITFQNYPDNIRHAYWRFIVNLRDSRVDRETLRDTMAGQGIKVDWPYAPLLHLQPAFQDLLGMAEGDLPNAEEHARHHFCLPIHYLIKEADAEFIADRLLEAL